LGGTERQQAAAISEAVQQHEPFFVNLKRLQDPGVAFHLLRVAGLPRANFIFRTHDPRVSRDGAEWFDGVVWAEILRVLDLHSIPDEVATTLLQLPAKMSGCAIRQYTPHLGIMYRCREKDEQHLAIKEVELRARKALMSTLPDELASICMSHAQTGATRIVTDHSMEITASAFVIGMKSRLLTVPLVEPGVKCACGGNPSYHHFMICPKLRGGAKIERHDQVTQELHDWLASIGIKSYFIKRALNWRNRSRPDLRVSRRGRTTLQLDTSITSPGRRIPTVRRKQPFAAADLRRKEKVEKFLASCRALGHEFRAFVFETTGAVPKTTRIVVNDLLVVSQVQTRNRVRDFKNELYQKVIAAIHEGNANIIGCDRLKMYFS
jgi:hypothetical protein